MHVALLHFHLNPGGVTSVIASHLRSLAAAGWPDEGRAVVLFDGQQDGWPNPLPAPAPTRMTLEAVPVLAYDQRQPATPREGDLLSAVESALERHGLNAGNCVLHVHNHSLGKNAALPAVVARLAERGYGVLLQLHDFAEDARPALYRRLQTALGHAHMGRLYPCGAQIHYAVLNRRDRNVLLAMGLPAAQVHYLPNPVAPPPPMPPRDEARQRLWSTLAVPRERELMLYPVRGIGRKNLGEWLLLAALQRQACWALTLAPRNPAELTRYQQWEALAAELKLPCWFDLGGAGRTPLGVNLAAADCMVSTSVAEGFGMAMLEPWTCGRGLVGRDLPNVTADFVDEGLQLDHLYQRLEVPVPWLGVEHLSKQWRAAALSLAGDYGVAPPGETRWREVVASKTRNDRVDFGDLGPADQMRVVRLAAGDPGARDELNSLNPVLATRPAPRQVQANAAIVRERFSLERCGARLRSIYEQVFAAPRDAQSARRGPPGPRPRPAVAL